MPCRFTVSMVTDDSEKALSVWRSALYRSHVALCPHCSAFRAQMKQTAAAARDVGSLEPPRPLDPRLLAAFRAQASGEAANPEDDGGDDPQRE
jgi:hypothetical protein